MAEPDLELKLKLQHKPPAPGEPGRVFALNLQSPGSCERIEAVRSFVGLDATGSFGILAGRERLMTVLSSGIMRITLGDGTVEYIGLPGGVLYFVDGELFISTTTYLRESDYNHLYERLMKRIHDDAQELAAMRESVKRMEEALLKQLVRQPGVLRQ